MLRLSKRITFNAPATLIFVLMCTAVTALNYVTDERSTYLLFCVYPSSLFDPFTYIRLFGHVLGHADWDHLINNMMYILILGPMLEEKYGWRNIVIVIVATALSTGIMHMLFAESYLLGASGVVFAFILLSSFTATGENEIPLTFILVAVLYIGQQIYQGMFESDDISQITHVIGGAVGSIAGFALSRMNPVKRRRYR